MIKKVTVTIRTDELSQITRISTETIVELVEYGVVEPAGHSPQNWKFDETMIRIVKRAARIQHDFNTDIAGTALALQLLQELEGKRLENRMLRQRLQRFMCDNGEKGQ